MPQLKKRIDDAQRRENDQNSLVVRLDNFQPEIIAGPYVEEWAAAFPQLIKPGVTIGVWNGPATAATHFRTIMQPNPASPQFGVWALVSTSEEAVQNMIDHGDLVPYGWYYRISSQLPTARQMLSARTPSGGELTFQSNFWPYYYASHPDEDPQRQAQREQQVQQVQQQALANLAAIELTVWKGGSSIFVARDNAESADPGGPHPGESIIDAGAWQLVTGGRSPDSYGMPLPFLTRDPGRPLARPAVQEYQSINQQYQQGSWKAAKALAYLGLVVDPGPYQQHRNLIADFLGL